MRHNIVETLLSRYWFALSRLLRLSKIDDDLMPLIPRELVNRHQLQNVIVRNSSAHRRSFLQTCSVIQFLFLQRSSFQFIIFKFHSGLPGVQNRVPLICKYCVCYSSLLFQYIYRNIYTHTHVSMYNYIHIFE